MTRPLPKKDVFMPPCEAGMYLPFFAVLLAALLAVVGLLMDTETLERTRIQLQKAVDAGVLAAMDYRIEVGFPKNPQEEQDIRDRITYFTEQNLIAQGFEQAKYLVLIS